MKVKLQQSTPQPSCAEIKSKSAPCSWPRGLKMDEMTSILPILAFGKREWILERKIR